MAKVISTAIDPIGIGIGKAITGKGSAIVNVNKGKSDSSSGDISTPSGSTVTPPQSYAEIEAQEKKNLLRAQQNRTKTVLTSPLGVADGGNVQRKVLLGA